MRSIPWMERKYFATDCECCIVNDNRMLVQYESNALDSSNCVHLMESKIACMYQSWYPNFILLVVQYFPIFTRFTMTFPIMVLSTTSSFLFRLNVVSIFGESLLMILRISNKRVTSSESRTVSNVRLQISCSMNNNPDVATCYKYVKKNENFCIWVCI